MLIRNASGQWHEPEINNYSDEASLQALLLESPELLPSTSGLKRVIVDELSIPGTGYLDLLTVDVEGNLCLIECKLRVNPEIRRAVIGQIFAYASGLSKLDYETLDNLYTSRAKKTLSSSIAEIAGSEWNESTFQQNVIDNLTAGRFELVITVDEITDELKNIVQYVNDHTTTDMTVYAFELGYAEDSGVQMIIPNIYGIESATKKAATSKRKWDEASLFEALANEVPATVVSNFRRVYDQALAIEGSKFNWGVGSVPSCTANIPINGVNISIWSCYSDPGRPNFAINFEYLLRGGSSTEQLSALAMRLRKIQALEPILATVEERGWLQRPSLPLGTIFGDADTTQIVLDAITELVS